MTCKERIVNNNTGRQAYKTNLVQLKAVLHYYSEISTEDEGGRETESQGCGCL